MLDLKSWDVEIELLEEMLGTVPKNRSVYSSYIAAKGREIIERDAKKGIPLADGTPADPAAVDARMAEGAETITEIEDKGWTGFHEDEDGPFLFDYVIKGFLSEASRTLKEIDKVKQLQDKCKRYLFVHPRRVRLPRPGRVEDFGGKPMLIVTDKGIVCERPLRAMTAQGPRVTVVRSDVVLAGARIKFRLTLLTGSGLTESIVRDVLSYGELIGLGQWRGGGWGRFSLVSMERADG